MDRRAPSGRALTDRSPAGRPPADAPPADEPPADEAFYEPPADEAFYGPDSEAWRLNREATLLLGAGPRALLMQIAHPLVAEGVDQHSDFRHDPWGRLAATLRSYLAIVYGSPAAGRAEVSRLNALHRAVAGPVRDGVARAVTGADAYEARDPALSLWVHATLVDSTIVAHDAWIEPLARERRERFYAETRPVGLAFGIPEAALPPDLAAFEDYLAGMLGPDGPIRVTPTARELAGTILHPPLAPLVRDGPLGPLLAPLLGRVAPAVYDWTLWPAIELLPAALRTGYGIPDDPLRRAVAAWLVAGWRGWRPLVPTSLRWLPQARAADRRIATST